MRIEVENLTATGQTFAHTYTPDELSLDDEDVRLSTEAVVEGLASRKRDEVFLRGTIKAGLEVACDRCLTASPFPVDIKFDAAFTPSSVSVESPENAELQADDLLVSFYEGDAIDVDELVREQILLSLPTRMLCKEECKGLCLDCGANLNAGEHVCENRAIDPRWSALAALKKEQD